MEGIRCSANGIGGVLEKCSHQNQGKAMGKRQHMLFHANEIYRHKALLLYKHLAEWEQQMKRKHKDISQQFLHVNNQWGGGRYMVEFCHCFPTCDDTIVEARL